MRGMIRENAGGNKSSREIIDGQASGINTIFVEATAVTIMLATTTHNVTIAKATEKLYTFLQDDMMFSFRLPAAGPHDVSSP